MEFVSGITHIMPLTTQLDTNCIFSASEKRKPGQIGDHRRAFKKSSLFLGSIMLSTKALSFTRNSQHPLHVQCEVVLLEQCLRCSTVVTSCESIHLLTGSVEYEHSSTASTKVDANVVCYHFIIYHVQTV